MKHEGSRQDDLKLIFSVVSLFLMLPPLFNSEGSYYTTLFIFLINRVIDMVFFDADDKSMFFIVWSLLNKWVGILACAIAFCMIANDFSAMFDELLSAINIGLFIMACSCVLKEMVTLIIKSILSKDLIRKIVNDTE